MFLHRVLLWGLLLSVSAVAAENLPETAWEKNLHFTVKPDNDRGFSVSADVEYRQVYLKESSDDPLRFLIYEPGTSKISKIKADIKGGTKKGFYLGSRAADFRDVFLTDDKVHLITYDGKFKPGDSLGYSYREQFDDLNYIPVIYIANHDRMRTARVMFSHPSGMVIKAELFAPRHDVSLRVDRSDPVQTVFIIDSLSESETLPFFAFNKLHAAILITAEFRGISVSAANPADFVRWYGARTELEPTLDSAWWTMFDSIVADKPTDLDKLEAIHNWVCGQIRYIADFTKDHSIFPHRPSEVLALRYGDCKDRACLLSAIARRYGLRVHMGLVSSDFEPPFAGIYLGAFDHVVCAYSSADTTLVFDPTAYLHPFGVLPDGIIAHPVFLLDPENPRWLQLNRIENEPDLEITIAGHIDSPANAGAVAVVRGDRLALSRVIATEQVRAPKERIISDAISQALINMTLSGFSSTHEASRSMTFACRADLSRFLIASSTARYLPAAPFRQLSLKVMQRAGDTLPIYFDSLQNIALTVRLRAPGWAIVPDTVSLLDSSGTLFSASAARGVADTVVVAYRLCRRNNVFAGIAKSSFLEFCQRYQAAAAEVFTIKETGK